MSQPQHHHPLPAPPHRPSPAETKKNQNTVKLVLKATCIKQSFHTLGSLESQILVNLPVLS